VKKLKVVAANGLPLNTIGWMAPIVSDGDICYALADGPARHFREADLGESAASGLITRLNPVALEDVFPGITRESMDRTGRGPLALQWYVLYVKEDDMAELGRYIGEDLDLAVICTAAGEPLQMMDSPHDFIVRGVSQPQLMAALQCTHDRMLRWLRMHLTGLIGSGKAELPSDDPSDRLAAVLYQASYDPPSARQAIALRGITLALSPNFDLFERWCKHAVAPWGLSEDRDYWRQRIEDVGLSLTIAHIFESISPMVDPGAIKEAVVDRIVSLTIGRLADFANRQ